MLKCYVGNQIQNSPVGGNSGASHSCIATPTGLLLEFKMKEIQLTRGYVTQVDDADYDELMGFKWHSMKDRNTVYAVRNTKLPNGKTSSFNMARHLLNTPKGFQSDHRDGNGLNNQRFNLRVCTRLENGRNRKRQHNNTSGYKGVCWHKIHKKWITTIRLNNKRIYLGYYFCIVKAAKAYDKAACELHGEFASLNFERTRK